MKTLGITGGIGGGKSTAVAFLHEFGAMVFDADVEAKRIMEEDPAVRHEIVKAFGDEAYDASGRLNRAYLASRTFGDEAAVKRLNAIVHPRVHAAFGRTRDDAEAAGERLLVYEAALLFESGGSRLLDVVALVDAPVETRIARATARDGSTREQVIARMNHQMDPEEARSRADVVLDNGGSPEDLRAQVEDLFQSLVAAKP